MVNDLLVTDTGVKGWAFVPQEGNSILSTLHAFMLQTGKEDVKDVLYRLQSELLRDEW